MLCINLVEIALYKVKRMKYNLDIIMHEDVFPKVTCMLPFLNNTHFPGKVNNTTTNHNISMKRNSLISMNTSNVRTSRYICILYSARW